MSAFRPGLAAALALSLLGCATGMGRLRHARMPPPALQSRAGVPLARSAGPDSGSMTPRAPARDDDRRRAVAAATALVGRRTIVVDGVDYGSDCAALVRAAFQQAGHPLPRDARDAAALYALALRRGVLRAGRQPAAGDIVFFAEHAGGGPAHVGLVTRSDGDGTAVVLHRVSRGVLRLRVNVAFPDGKSEELTGKRRNDTFLVAGRPIAAGRLVVAVADLLRDGG